MGISILIFLFCLAISSAQATEDSGASKAAEPSQKEVAGKVLAEVEHTGGAALALFEPAVSLLRSPFGWRITTTLGVAYLRGFAKRENAS